MNKASWFSAQPHCKISLPVRWRRSMILRIGAASKSLRRISQGARGVICSAKSRPAVQVGHEAEESFPAVLLLMSAKSPKNCSMRRTPGNDALAPYVIIEIYIIQIVDFTKRIRFGADREQSSVNQARRGGSCRCIKFVASLCGTRRKPLTHH